MGVDSRKLTKEQLAAAGLERQASRRVRRKLGPPINGHFLLCLSIDPPTVTHHSKKIAIRGGKLGMVDSRQLRAAREAYLRAIPECRGGRPLAPPVDMVVRWVFPDPERTGRHTEKPDFDNLAKTLIDCLAERGYLADDCHVSDVSLIKRWGAAGQVDIYGRSVPDDRADHGMPGPAGRNGGIEELAEALGRADVAAMVKKSHIPTAGRPRKKDRPRPRVPAAQRKPPQEAAAAKSRPKTPPKAAKRQKGRKRKRQGETP